MQKKFKIISSLYIFISSLGYVYGQEIAVKLINPQNASSLMYYSIESSMDGICRAQGFERVLPGSWHFNSQSGQVDRLVVNFQGSIVRTSLSHKVSEITCLSKERQTNGIARLHNPSDPRTGMKFSIDSSKQGVCRAMGYRAELPGSWTYDRGLGLTETLVVDERGNIIKTTLSSKILGIECLY